MASTINHGDEPHVSVMPDVKSAAAFRAIKLVRGKRSQVDFGVNDIQRNFAQSLYGIRVEEHAALAAELANFLNRLEHSSFIVRRHDADENRLDP